MEKFNAELREQLVELDKDYRQLQDAKTKIEAHFETLLDQVKQQEVERQNLVSAVPKLQEAITLIERSNRGVETSGMQQTLKRIGNVMNEQNKRDKHPTVMRGRNIRIHPSETSRDSILSMFSDTSSVTDSCPAEEEMSRSSSNTNDETTVTVHSSNSDLKNKISSDTITKSEPLVKGNRHRPTISDQTTVRNVEQVESLNQIPTEAATDNTAAEPTLVLAPAKSEQDTTKSIKETPHRHARQKSCDSNTKQRSNTHPRKVSVTHHQLVSDVPESSTKRGRSQSFKYDDRVRERFSPPQSQSYLQANELQLKLAEQRKKINI